MEESNFLFQEKYASGYSQKNFLTKMGGASGVLQIIITPEELIFKTNAFFSLFASIYDINKRIPIENILSIKPKKVFFRKGLEITYKDETGSSMRYVIKTKNAAKFKATLKSRNDYISF